MLVYDHLSALLCLEQEPHREYRFELAELPASDAGVCLAERYSVSQAAKGGLIYVTASIRCNIYSCKIKF